MSRQSLTETIKHRTICASPPELFSTSNNHSGGNIKNRLPGAGRGAAFKADGAPCTQISVLHGVNHGDVRVDFDALAVENRRPIPPLPNGFHRGLVKSGSVTTIRQDWKVPSV